MTKNLLKSNEKVARVMKLLAWIGLISTVLICASVVLPSLHQNSAIPTAMVFMTLLLFVFNIALLLVARGVSQKKDWARRVGQLYGVIALFGFPIGTIIGVYILWQLKTDNWSPESIYG